MKVCCLILSHGRANNVQTFDSLRTCGYTGDIKIIVDSDDKQKEKYLSIYGDNVIIFNKSEYIGKIDRFTNEDIRNTVLFARNAVLDIIKRLDYDYFVELDDDYTSFSFRPISDFTLKNFKTKNLDLIFKIYIDLLEKTKSDCIAMSQAGDYIGGVGSSDGQVGNVIRRNVIRKVMNCFIFKKDKPLSFIGAMNDDVNTYLRGGNVGKLFFTPLGFMLTQNETQQNSGGLTDMYLQHGTYKKSFMSVMVQPSSVTVRLVGTKKESMRMHHSIKWKNTVPCIIREEYKKGGTA